MLKIILISIILWLSSVQAAVHVSETGTGQVAVVPFYTVANGLNTLVSINNSFDQPKALKIHFREAKLGDAIYSFNLYLDADDIWVMALAESNGVITLLTTDRSCTLNLGGPILSADSVWNTGTIEIIEMGVISEETGLFASGLSQDENCQLLSDAWDSNNPDNLWVEDSSNGILPASGGVHVETNIINVSDGYAFPIPTLVLDNFHPAMGFMNTAPDDELPDLSSGENVSLVYYDGQAIKTTWPTGYEAVSALFMKNTLENEFNFEASIGAKTEWVLSFPTLRYHLINSETQKPFIVLDGGNGDSYFNFPRDFGYGYTMFDREAQPYMFFHCGLPCGPIPTHSLSHQVNIYLIQESTADYKPVLTNAESSNAFVFSPLNSNVTDTGKLRLDVSETFSHSIPNDRGIGEQSGVGYAFHGLPVLGFSFQSFKNANAQPGLLATYGTSQTHYGKRKIENFEF